MLIKYLVLRTSKRYLSIGIFKPDIENDTQRGMKLSLPKKKLTITKPVW